MATHGNVGTGRVDLVHLNSNDVITLEQLRREGELVPFEFAVRGAIGKCLVVDWTSIHAQPGQFGAIQVDDRAVVDVGLQLQDGSRRITIEIEVRAKIVIRHEKHRCGVG